MEDIAKKIVIQTPILLIGGVLLVIGAIGYWPFTEPPIQIQVPILNGIMIGVGLLLILFGIVLSMVQWRHHSKVELDEVQLARLQQELRLKSETLVTHRELLSEQEKILTQRRGEITEQLEELKNEVSDKNEDLAQLQQKFALTLLHQKISLQIAESESERIFGEYQESYWSLYRRLVEEGLINIDLSLEEVRELDDDSLQKQLLAQFQNAFALKSISSLSKLFKGPELKV